MRRRSRAGGKSAKLQRRKTTTPERRNASEAVRRGDRYVADLQARFERQARELNEAREQQADVLKVISRSTFDLQTVLDTPGRICGATVQRLSARQSADPRCALFRRSPPNSWRSKPSGHR